MDQQSGNEFTSQDSAGEFLLYSVSFSIKLLGFMSKAIKLLLTELVNQSKQEYIALSLFRIDLLLVSTGKAACNIVLH